MSALGSHQASGVPHCWHPPLQGGCALVRARLTLHALTLSRSFSLFSWILPGAGRGVGSGPDLALSRALCASERGLGWTRQTPMAQGRSTKIISTMKWIRTTRFSINYSLSRRDGPRRFSLEETARGAEHGRVCAA
jgi:hypothetical protein